MIQTENHLSYIIRSRRTTYSFRPDKVDDEIVLQGLDYARWAPNHKLTNPWSVVLIGDRTAAKIVDLNTRLVREKRGDKSAEAKRRVWSAVPNWMAVTSRISEDAVRTKEDYASTSCFIHNLSLYLWSKGIGTKWTTGAVTRYDDVYPLLGIDPAEHDLVGLIWYGYPDEPPPPSARTDVTDWLTRVD